jgi:hypothetical protein
MEWAHGVGSPQVVMVEEEVVGVGVLAVEVSNMTTSPATDCLMRPWHSRGKSVNMEWASERAGKIALSIVDHEVNHFATMRRAGMSKVRWH